MTDKIMIGGINVAECKHFENANNEMGCSLHCCGSCQTYKDCDFKNFKRKEQECEVLKQSENEAGEIVAELKNDYAELEKRHNDSFKHFQNLKNKYDKYKQALDEIGDIAEHNNFLVRDPFCGPDYRDLSSQILDIINKAKEE